MSFLVPAGCSACCPPLIPSCYLLFAVRAECCPGFARGGKAAKPFRIARKKTKKAIFSRWVLRAISWIGLDGQPGSLPVPKA